MLNYVGGWQFVYNQILYIDVVHFDHRVDLLAIRFHCIIIIDRLGNLSLYKYKNHFNEMKGDVGMSDQQK